MGSDENCGRKRMEYTHLNPRSRMGSDWMDMTRMNRMDHFNPRSRMGSDGSPYST